MSRPSEIEQLRAGLQAVWRDLNLSPAFADRLDPDVVRDGEINFLFALDEEDKADQLIRGARRTMASFGLEYWLPHYHPLAAHFGHEGHLQYKVHKSLYVSNLQWMVSFALCGPEEGYSFVETSA